jgi:hypothetical protein
VASFDRHTRLVVAGIGVALAMAGCGSGPSVTRDARPAGANRAVPSGTLYLANTQPGTVTVVDVARAHTRTLHLRELYPGDPPYMIAVIDRRLVVFGHLRTYAFGLDLREPARSLGDSWFFVPSATPGRVWLALLDPASPATARDLRAVREVTTDGRATLAHSARPPHWPLAAVDSGLLMQGSTLELWQPRTGRILRTLPGVFPLATRHALAVTCPPRCRTIHVTDTDTGADTIIRPGPGVRFTESYDGAFSPDGTLVAVPAHTRDGHAHVAIIDLAHRTARLVPGARLARDYTLMTWSSTGWLFYNAGHGHLAAYGPGNARATLLPVHVQPFVRMAAR